MPGTITRQIQEEAVAYIQKHIKVSSADCRRCHRTPRDYRDTGREQP